MKRTICIFLTCLLLAGLLSACGCRHEWIAANCDNAQTCNLCGEVQGDALGHDWKDASCASPKRCLRCGRTEGEALDHQWQEATTEAPKTCSVCGATEGTRIDTDSRFHTADCSALFGTWNGRLTMNAADETELPLEMDLTYYMDVTYTFHNNGTMDAKIVPDMDTYLPALRVISLEETYAALAAEGIDRDQADEAMRQQVGMDVAGYVDSILNALDVNDLTMEVSGVYYVADGKLYEGDDWDEEFETSQLTVAADKLTLTDTETGQTLELTNAQRTPTADC